MRCVSCQIRGMGWKFAIMFGLRLVFLFATYFIQGTFYFIKSLKTCIWSQSERSNSIPIILTMYYKLVGTFKTNIYNVVSIKPSDLRNMYFTRSIW